MKNFKGFAARPQTPVVRFRNSPLAATFLMLNENWDYIVPAFRKDFDHSGEVDTFTFTSKENWDRSVDPRKSFYQMTNGGGDFDKVKTYLKVQFVSGLVRSYERNKHSMGYEVVELNELVEAVKAACAQSGLKPEECWEAVMLSEEGFGVDQIIDYLLEGEEVTIA